MEGHRRSQSYLQVSLGSVELPSSERRRAEAPVGVSRRMVQDRQNSSYSEQMNYIWESSMEDLRENI
jgi:hypothetical protein